MPHSLSKQLTKMPLLEMYVEIYLNVQSTTIYKY